MNNKSLKNYIPKVLGGVLLIILATWLVTPAPSDPNNPVLFSTVSPAEFNSEISSTEAVILDLRTPAEVSSGKIAGATNIDYYKSDFRDKLAELDKSASYKIYCNSGKRSATTMSIMRSLGFSDVTELQGGIQAWLASGLSACVDC